MKNKSRQIRKSVIPDDSVKILELCLSTEENGIVLFSSRQKVSDNEYSTDSLLKNLIAAKIKEKVGSLPLTLRKVLIYEKAKKEQISENIDDCLLVFNQFNKMSIVMRKYLRCMQLKGV